MFERLARVFKSWIGYFISFAEDPEVMLQQSIEEMRNTLPKLNQILVTTRATVLRLEQEKEELSRKERQLTANIKAALTEGSPEARKLAEGDALLLQQVRTDLAAVRDLAGDGVLRVQPGMRIGSSIGMIAVAGLDMAAWDALAQAADGEEAVRLAARLGPDVAVLDAANHLAGPLYADPDVPVTPLRAADTIDGCSSRSARPRPRRRAPRP